MNIIKRNGNESEFDVNKIVTALEHANDSVIPGQRLNETQIQYIATDVERHCQSLSRTVSVEDIQDMVEDRIMLVGKYTLARNYITYRYRHALARKSNETDDRILSLIGHTNEDIKQENSNKNPMLNSTQRDYIAGEVSKDISARILLPDDIVNAHKEGIIHFHDMDYYIQPMANCCLVNLKDMFENGTVITDTLITTPHSFHTACNIATQIIAQVASSQFGGQTISMAHLAPFVNISRKHIRQQVYDELTTACAENTSADIIDKITEERVKKEITDGIQTIQYQLLTLMTTNGQTPFVTIYLDLEEVPDGRLRDDLAMCVEEVLKQRIKGIQDRTGAWVTPAFPKLIYTLTEDNITSGSKYYYLSELAAKCVAARMVPDFISSKIMRQLKGDVYPCMGCRSFLTPDKTGMNADGTHKYYGRFNQGVVTINLVDVACSSKKDMNAFWYILEERLDLCHKALRLRHEHLKGTVSDVAPILWQHGALARLQPGEVIDKLLYNNYSTISLGYAGIYEMCYYMTGKSHTSPEGRKFALAVMQKLNDKCAEWRAAENISYSLYGTPIESTTYKFAKCLQKRFGIIPNVTDHTYITNSYHINVREEINAFDKLTKESEFQALSPGGAISYVEIPSMKQNIPAILAVMKHIYNTILYAELNTKLDHCDNCGFDGEIKIITDNNGKLVWECPNCGCREQTKMHVVRRTCGYLGSQYWNQGRTAEIKDRVLHL